MNIVKPTIGGAISSITKGIKQLEAVMTSAGATAVSARQKISDADAEMRSAQEEMERAARIKAKLEELVA